MLPVEEFRTERWRDMDADVEFTGKRIVHSDQLPISDLYTHLVLNDGLLRLEPCASAWPAASWSRTSAWTAASSRCRAE
ncbi:asmA family protein [Pseudomonas aeruginosa]|nr:asmA family protein [Pseudomonas aeruginosa]